MAISSVLTLQNASLAVLALVTWALGVVFHRLYFHKLAAFPGPRLAAATHLYEWYYDIWLGGQYTWKLKELHEQYGPVIRVNPEELHFNDPEYYDQIFNNSNGNTEKPFRSANAFGPYPAAIGTIGHDLHRVRRSGINPFFSRQSVAEAMPFSITMVENLCGRFEEAAKNGDFVNLKYAYAALAMDIITQYCFAESHNRVLKPDFDRRSLDDIDGFAEFSLLNMNLPWLFTPIFNLPDWISRKINPAMADVLDWRGQLSDQIEGIRSGRNQQHKLSGHKTIFHSLLQSNLPAQELTPERLRDEAFSLVAAGSGTNAYVLKTTSFYITKNPDIHRKLLDELKTVLPKRDDEPSLTRLEQLPYLTAVILEGLRISNAVSHRLFRSFPEKSLTYDRYTVPPNTTVTMTSLLIHENEKIFPEPKKFKPERWLGDDQQRLKRYLTPFSRGTRACVGPNLAWAELYIVLGTIFRRFEFDMSRVDQKRDIDMSRDTLIAATARDSPGVLVTVKKAI